MFGIYYAELYSEMGPQPSWDAISTYLNGFSLPSLSQEQGECLIEPITGEEVTEMIRGLTPGKAPDGFLVEFYKSFEPLLAPILLRACNEIVLSTAPIPPPGRKLPSLFWLNLARTRLFALPTDRFHCLTSTSKF